jgi:hypothetical protein
MNLRRMLVAAFASAALFMAYTGALAQTCINPTNTQIEVNPGNPSGWALRTTGTPLTASAQYVNGPANPPLGQGSVQFSVGANGDGAAEIRNTDYSGTKLSELTALSYSTYVQQGGSGGQAPYLILNIDLDNNGTVDDQLFFEPVYQSGTYGGDTVPNQCGTNPFCVAVGQWQTWDALVGGWWSLNAGTFGPPLTTLASYAAANPDATIVNSSNGLGGVRIVTGFGAGAWDNFVGNADAFVIGVNCENTTYNFEAEPSNAEHCKKGGWSRFTSPTFKNQGQCVQYVNTGK